MGVKVARLETGKYAFTADAVDLKYSKVRQEYNTDAKQLRGIGNACGPYVDKNSARDQFLALEEIKLEEEGWILISMVLSYWAQILTIAKKITFIMVTADQLQGSWTFCWRRLR